MVRSILLIDPDKPSVRLVRAVLEGEGWQVVDARDAEHARALLPEVRPSAIVTALAVSPHEAVDHVRELRTMRLPVVAVTSMNGPETEYRVRDAGCADFIRKPIDVASFAAQLGSCVGEP